MKKYIATLLQVALLSTTATTFARLQRPMPGRRLVKKIAPSEAFTKNAIIMVGKLTAAKVGPSTMSLPPTFICKITLGEIEMFRGDKPKGDTFSYMITQMNPPQFPVDKKVIVTAAKSAGGQIIIKTIAVYTDELAKQAKASVMLPVGWTIKDGKPLSPWSKVSDYKWPKDSKITAKLVCSETGRPVLMTGSGIKITVKQVPPVKKIKWQNSYGDGEFTITVTNASKKSITIPSLLKSGDEILWQESLIIMTKNDKSPRFFPEGAVLKNLSSVTLKAGESISTKLNLLELTHMRWPRGGARIYFSFCLGELSTESFFYYYSKHHDKLLK